MSTGIECLYCGEAWGAIRASQRTQSPIFCAGVDYFGEVEWENERHRFKSWTDSELHRSFRIKPEYYDLYRRVFSSWEILAEHRF